jgi:Tfp pilus assembly protein PilW
MFASSTSTPRSDEGFTLIELLVYISLATVVLFIVGGFMISSLETERDVTSAAEATTSGQLVSTSIQAAVRNGAGMRVETAYDGDQMLLAFTYPGDATEPVCQAWFYSATAQSVYTKTTSPAFAIEWPPSSPEGSWTLLGSGIEPVNPVEPEEPEERVDTGIFGPFEDLPPAGRVITPKSDAVSLKLDVTAGTRKPIRIDTTTFARVESITGGPCFS